MTPISIAERLKPFDHNPGTTCLLPGSHRLVEIFPSLIHLYDLQGPEKVLLASFKIDLEGPVKAFTVQLNLEKGHVSVFGEGVKGYFRYRLTSSLDNEGLIIQIEKAINQQIHFSLISDQLQMLIKNDREILVFKNSSELKPYEGGIFERLSLGNHKSQDWTLVQRRQDLKEIFPIWLALGLSLPDFQTSEALFGGTTALLKQCGQAIKNGDRNELLPLFETLYTVGFEKLMTPRLICDHLGVKLPVADPKGSPLILLKTGATLIRSMFASFEGQCLEVLPALPPKFHSGRYLHFKCQNLGFVDLEWSKKLIRRMIFFAREDGLIELKWQPEIKQFRLRDDSKTLNRRIEIGAKIKIEKGRTYFFDCFRK